MKNFKNVHLGKSVVALTSVSKMVVPQTKKIEIDNSNQDVDGEIIPWGSDNLYPQNFYNKKFLKNGASVGGINTLKSTIHGNGFTLFKKVKNVTTGKIELQEQLLEELTEIADFVELNVLEKFWYGKITDQSLFEIAFTEHVVSMNGEKIVRVKRHKAAHCRFAAMKQGRIPYVYVNTDWEVADKAFTVAIPYFDHSEMTVQEIKDECKKKKIFNFMTSSVYPLVDESYYPKAGWHAVDRSGWIDVANSVPELKQALFQNQNHFKYIVYISDEYFELYYKEEWDDFDADKRQQLREELATAIDEHMSGNKAAGRSLISPIFDDATGKPVKGIIIEPVDNKLKDGSYLPDAASANSEILFAIGVNPAIIGAGTPGGSNLGGSGSNIREAYTVLSASLAPKRNYVKDDWDFWRAWNKWDRALIGTFPSVNLTTLDKNPNGQETVIHE
jgi:hypothetical protein